MFDKFSEVTLKVVSREIEGGGYFFILKIEHFIDRNIALIEVRGKDPLMSSVKRFKVDVRDLTMFYDMLSGKVNYNFNIVDGNLMIPNEINVDRFNYISPSNFCEEVRDRKYTLKTPVEVLWELVCGDYSFIWDGCECVPCDLMHFGDDNFSINVDRINSDGSKEKVNIIEYHNGRYKYSDMYVVPNDNVESPLSPEMLFGDIEYKFIKDDLGRLRRSFVLNLKRFESSIYNTDKYDKIYSRDYTLTVIDMMYCMASYINGINMILADMGVECQSMVIPCKSSNSFTLELNKQHDTFTIQNICYSYDIIDSVRNAYTKHKEDLTNYLRTKDVVLRSSIYNMFIRECGDKFGVLLHYFVNGVLDALAIQKGDKRTRVQILSDYSKTVHRELLMYGLYFYDLRTMFIRNNFRIEKEFKDTLIVNSYNGSYFRVG